ncbi:hypothetical protein GCM10020254_62820 [Streptomyces goshikiensis]
MVVDEEGDPAVPLEGGRPVVVGRGGLAGVQLRDAAVRDHAVPEAGRQGQDAGRVGPQRAVARLTGPAVLIAQGAVVGRQRPPGAVASAATVPVSATPAPAMTVRAVKSLRLSGIGSPGVGRWCAGDAVVGAHAPART